MAENSNYIGVSMGLDVTDLKTGLSEANKQIQLANSEFKAASSGMEDWTKSTEGLSAKVKQLDSVLKMQQAKLSGLRAEYERVAASQGENSEAARKLKVQINNQQSVVNRTQKEFTNYSNVLEQAEAGTLDLEKATIKANGEIKDFGDSAKKAGDNINSGFGAGVVKGIAGGIAAIGAAAVAAVGSFLSLAESTREFREDTARLDAAFKGAGLSAESAKNTYTELYRAIGETDTAVEASQQIALLADSEEEAAKWANLATGVVGTFGDALKPETFYEAANETIKLGEATGAFTQMLEGTGMSVEEFNAGLAACTTEQEKQAYMLEVSEKALGAAGAAYEETAGDILDAREATAGYEQALAELGAIAEPIMTTLKVLATELLTAVTPFVELIGTGLMGAMSGTAGASAQLAEGLGGIADVVIEKITGMLPTILSVILGLIPQIADTLLSAAPQLLTVITDLVVQVINMLSVLLPQIALKFVEILPVLVNSLISAIPQLLQAATQLLLAIVQAIPILVQSLVAALPSVAQTIIAALIQSIPILLETAIQLLNAIIEAIPVIVRVLTQNLPKIIDTILSGILDALPLLLDAAITLFFALIDAIPVIVQELYSAMPQIIAAIVSSLLKAAPKILKTAWQLFVKIIESAQKLRKEIPKKMGEIITAIVKGLTDGLSKIKGVGKDLIEGLWDGIKDMTGWITDKLEGFGDTVLTGIKNFFGVKSPSKLMRDEVGQYIGQGIGVGVMDSLPFVKKQLTKFSDYVAGNLGGIKAGLSVNSGGTASGSGSVPRGNTIIDARQTIQYNGKLSRKQIKRQEIDHYNAVKMRLKTEGAI